MGQPKSRGANLTPPPPSITKQRPGLATATPRRCVSASGPEDGIHAPQYPPTAGSYPPTAVSHPLNRHDWAAGGFAQPRTDRALDRPEHAPEADHDFFGRAQARRAQTQGGRRCRSNTPTQNCLHTPFFHPQNSSACRRMIGRADPFWASPLLFAKSLPRRRTTTPRDALAGKGPPRRPQKRLDRRLEEVAKAVGGGYCRLQMPLRLALGVRGTAAGHRPGALEGGGYLLTFQCIPGNAV